LIHVEQQWDENRCTAEGWIMYPIDITRLAEWIFLALCVLPNRKKHFAVNAINIAYYQKGKDCFVAPRAGTWIETNPERRPTDR
jgi:hypothetical protein